MQLYAIYPVMNAYLAQHFYYAQYRLNFRVFSMDEFLRMIAHQVRNHRYVLACTDCNLFTEM